MNLKTLGRHACCRGWSEIFQILPHQPRINASSHLIPQACFARHFKSQAPRALRNWQGRPRCFHTDSLSPRHQLGNNPYIWKPHRFRWRFAVHVAMESRGRRYLFFPKGETRLAQKTPGKITVCPDMDSLGKPNLFRFQN